MNQPSPAIVAQTAVRRLPRLALLLLCLAYVLPGFIGRDPWKSADMTAFGYMFALANQGLGSAVDWLHPTLIGQPPEVDALLPYWLGAWAMQFAPGWIAPDMAARLPFGLLLGLTLGATWWGVYRLARSRGAQPVAFAFGGEARPADYGRAVADGGLLALIACLGLAQLSHETTPGLAQLCFTSLLFYAVAALPDQRWQPNLIALLALVGLTLCGAPSVALLLGLGSALVLLLDRTDGAAPFNQRLIRVAGLLLACVLAAALATQLDLWRWRITAPPARWVEWRNIARLFLWFTWPAWPLVLWTLWRWRLQLRHLSSYRHLALPLWFAAVAVALTLWSTGRDRSLLLGLPALATLAAFALPTLRRSVAALIDWFTLLFFTSCSITIWVIWIAMQTGVPRQPAANVARLAPGFAPTFSLGSLALALAATLAWAWLVKWRTGRHRTALWKSMVLPASGAVLCWLLLTTLWLPLLNYARSYAPMVRSVVTLMDAPQGCVDTHGLSRAQTAAFVFHGPLALQPAQHGKSACDWLIVDQDAAATLPSVTDLRRWTLFATVRRPTDAEENILLYRRVKPTGR